MKTVMEELLSACTDAYRSRRPLIFVNTDEMEIIRRIAASDRLIPRVMRRTGGSGDLEEEYRFCTGGGDPLRATPRVFREECVSSYSSDVSALNVRAMGAAQAGTYWGKKERFPVLFILHVPYERDDAFSPAQRIKLMEFVDQYERDPDDNSPLRSSLVLLYGNVAALPRELRPYCSIADVALPGREEIIGIVNGRIGARGLPPLHEDDARSLAYALSGFSLVETERQVEALLNRPDIGGYRAVYDIRGDLAIITAQKEQMLKREKVLELVKVGDDISEIGGMRGFMDWFMPMRDCIRQSGRLQDEAGVTPPRGVLMCGVPGCGKSLAAKQISRALNLPLLQMEMGRLMGRYVGESERNMAQALKLAEAMAPCVLWIDELEKGFGDRGGGSDNGIFKRMLGSLLTWMQENTKPCFIFATANDITGMPKEFFRSGRFDELFAVYMPTRDECAGILAGQMRRVGRRIRGGGQVFAQECFGEEYLRRLADGFVTDRQGTGRPRFVTGADIEKLVRIAMTNLWLRGGRQEPIRADEWSLSLKKALDSTTVYGDGPENLDSIAACYLRLVRNNFRPAADFTLFRAEDYRTELKPDGGIAFAGFRGQAPEGLSDYDRALYDALGGRLNALALDFERNARAQLVR